MIEVINLPEDNTKNDINQLRRDFEDFKALMLKDEYSTYKIFRKKCVFLQSVNLTGDDNPIADGTYTFDKTTDTTIAITTKNGIITNISKT